MTEFPYSNQQISEAFSCSQSNIREHKSKHSDELKRNVDYVSLPDRNYKVMWSKSGVTKLADYIGTDQAKLFIAQFIEQKIEKPLKKIVPSNTEQPNSLVNLPDSQLIGLMEMMVASMKRQSEKLNTLEINQQKLETRIEEVGSQKSGLSVIQVRTAKEFKTLKIEKKSEIGAEINELVKQIFIYPHYTKEQLKDLTKSEQGELYRQAHRQARNYYWDSEKVTYVGAKKASFESKLKFLNWLKKVKI